jgi:hypothetical protein
MIRPMHPDERTTQVMSALTDFPVWKSMVDRGVAKEVIKDVVKRLLLCYLTKARARKK